MSKWDEDKKGREDNVLNKFKKIPSIPELNKLCTKLHKMWLGADATERKARYMEMRVHYKEMVAEYFKRRFIEPKDIMAPYKEQDGSKVIWATYHMPVLIIGMMVYDEVFIEHGVTYN